MIFNLSLIPIGNSYWVSATKIGSNYIKTFMNPTERYLRLAISNVIETHQIDTNWIYVTFPNGLKLKFKIFDFDNVDYTHLYDDKFLLDIFKKVNNVLIRNPLERFKSGLVQKISELYTSIDIDKLDSVKFHNDIYLNLTKYDVDFSLLRNGIGVTPKLQNPYWQLEWDKFTQLVISDIFRRNDIDKILLEDLHTQPVYHLFCIILNSLPNWDTIKTIDINDLDSYSKLIINEIGNDEYLKRYQLLHNREEWNIEVEGQEYITTLKRVSNKRLYFDSPIIPTYFETTMVYILERMYYDILNEKRYKKLL
jgi:hypothetical protein